MQSIAQLSIADLQAYSKCVQLYYMVDNSLMYSQSAIKQAKRLIRKKGDINFQVPPNSNDESVGNTLLHMAWDPDCSEITENLLNLGADFTLKNKGGDTALLYAFRLFGIVRNESLKYQDESPVNLLLSAHVKFDNPSNLCDDTGFSHFHIACMVNHMKAVEFFLKNGVDVNQAASREEKWYPGFTPLHLAVKYYSIETVELLLKHGADRNKKNDHKMTPLHQLINRKIELLEEIRRTRTEAVKTRSEDKIEKIEKIIFMLLGNNFLDNVQIIDDTNLSSFHIACTMQDSCQVESLLEQIKDIDQCVKMDSPVWPGFTALHFAALCNINTMKLLHRRGADIDVKNAKGLTPIDICIGSGHVEDIHAAVSLKTEWANILFSDNKTRLVDFTYAMQDTTQLNYFLRNCMNDINMTLPSNFALWPGYTPLHVAVAIGDAHFSLERESILKQIEELLNFGADVTWKDANGKTPLHHAFRKNKSEISSVLRKHHHSSANPVDEDNLSHLHIACAESDEVLVEKILSGGRIDVNIPYKGEKDVQRIKPGWMPLNCVSYSDKIKQMLINQGAIAFSPKAKEIPPQEPYGTDTLHYACEKSDKEAVQRLLGLGADVDSALDDGRTPLYIAVNGNSQEVVELLLQRGADFLAKARNGDTPLYRVLRQYYCSSTNRNDCGRSIILVLKQQAELQERIEKETGITMLHIACCMLDVEEVRRQLDLGVNVDARVHEDSYMWSELTALQVLIMKVTGGLSKDEVASDAKVITDLLLEKGADVMLTDDDEITLVHLSYESQDTNFVSRTKSLLKNQRDFGINPINNYGLSHFHLAVKFGCVEVVEKFLEHGVNVNQATDFFADCNNDCTALHMAAEKANIRIVDLLLKHGADVNLEDADGYSALRKVVQMVGAGSSRLDLMEKLLSRGADINSEDIYGVTPFESLLNSDDTSAEDIRLFLKHGCRVNVSNPAEDYGYLGIILAKTDKAHRDLLLEELMKAPDVGTVNEFGRTLMHNVVAVREPAISSKDYVDLLNSFNAFGYDIDDQDQAGQTALHLAAIFGNDKAITALQSMGADADIVDSKGKSALTYAIEPCTKCENDGLFDHHHEEAVEALAMQVLKVYSSGIPISCLNYDNLAKASEILSWGNKLVSEDDFLNDDDLLESSFYSERNNIHNFFIKPISLDLDVFLSDRNAAIRYCRMPESHRQLVDRAFESAELYFDVLLPILKLQHRKATMRLHLLQAASSLEGLVGFPLPDLCSEKILRYLSNRDLKRLVAAMNLGD